MSQYDPYTYGQVQLGGKTASPAVDGADSPDDMLFAAGSAATAPAEPAEPAASSDSDWELLEGDMGSLLPPASKDASDTAAAIEFGSEVLGEQDAGAELLPRAGTRAAAAATATGERPATAGGKAQRRASIVRAPLPASQAAEQALSGAKITAPKRSVARARRPRLLATLAPGLLLASGGSGAGYFWLMEQNAVMAGIAAALTLVGAAFARVWLRR